MAWKKRSMSFPRRRESRVKRDKSSFSKNLDFKDFLLFKSSFEKVLKYWTPAFVGMT
ncbi:hypothetical protein O6R16_05625 [Candidatus Rickettsia tasmanensis]